MAFLPLSAMGGMWGSLPMGGFGDENERRRLESEAQGWGWGRQPGQPWPPPLTDTTTGQTFTPGSPEAQAMDALRQMGQSAQQEPAPDPAAVEQLRQMGQQAQTPLDPAAIADLQRLTGQLQQAPDANVTALQQTVQRLQQPMMAPGRYTWQGQLPATLFQNLGIQPPRPGQTIWGGYGAAPGLMGGMGQQPGVGRAAG